MRQQQNKGDGSIIKVRHFPITLLQKVRIILEYKCRNLCMSLNKIQTSIETFLRNPTRHPRIKSFFSLFTLLSTVLVGHFYLGGSQSTKQATKMKMCHSPHTMTQLAEKVKTFSFPPQGVLIEIMFFTFIKSINIAFAATTLSLFLLSLSGKKLGKFLLQ